MSRPSCKDRAKNKNKKRKLSSAVADCCTRCTATDRVHAYVVYRKPYVTLAMLNVLKKKAVSLTCSTIDGQDGTEWAETGLTGNEKIEDTVQCVSQNSRPGHATIHVSD